MTKVAIIVLHFGNVNDTYECLMSLKTLKTSIPHTVYVVDNGTHAIKQKDIQQILQRVIFIKNDINGGFSRGNNLAISQILKENFSHILLLNNDTLITPYALDKLINAFKNPTVGIVGPIITYQKKPKTIWFAGGYLNKTFCFTKHIYAYNKNKDLIDTDFITGAAMMIKREVFEKVGLLPDEYFLYWEDVDFCFAAKQKGYLSKVLEENLVLHKVSAASGIKGKNTLSPLQAYYYGKNPFIFMKKYNLQKFTGIVGQCASLIFYMGRVQNIYAAGMYIKGFFEGLQNLFI